MNAQDKLKHMIGDLIMRNIMLEAALETQASLVSKSKEQKDPANVKESVEKE